MTSPFSNKALEADWSKIVTVEVGGMQPEFGSQTVAIDYTATRTFFVYEDLFRAQSPFFEAALGRDFIEAKDRVVKLPEHTPDAFDVYLRWANSYQIFVPGMEGRSCHSDDEKNTQHEIMIFSLFCRAYVLGDVLQDSDFKDALIDAFIEEVALREGWPTKEARYVYENTMRDAPMRHVLAAMAATGCLGEFDQEIRGDDFCNESAREFGNIDFFCDVLKIADQMLSKTTGTIAWHEETCRFHEHKSGPCYSIRAGIEIDE
ncbi:hypothetical protein FKW77_002513 [Venturia effusa]|uniref:BTB domain-containing protein n=1 Tax=Venturia effusa TaxID=50376 RepID=A0A517LJS3_9PEZI|nr:hypothetical protein FKW77_002513 [Venturia effusa]